MASPFDAALSSADAVITSVFGETVEVRPRRDVPRAAPIADPDRPARRVAAAISLAAGIGDIGGARLGSKLGGVTRVGVEGGTAWLSAEVAASLGYAVASGDLVVRIDEDGSPAFAVVGPPRTSAHGDLTLTIAPEAIP